MYAEEEILRGEKRNEVTMGFEIIKKRPSGTAYTAVEKLWLAPDGGMHRDGFAPNGSQLFCVPGDIMPLGKARAHGLIDDSPETPIPTKPETTVDKKEDMVVKESKPQATKELQPQGTKTKKKKK